MKYFATLVFVFSLTFCFGQKDSTVVLGKQVLDSLEKTHMPYDTTRGKRFKKIVNNLGKHHRLVIGIDSFTKHQKPKVVFWRSMAIPGTGQIMNKDYWKVPVVYLAAAGGFWALASNNNRYQEYIGIVEKMDREKLTSYVYPEGSNAPGRSIQTFARAASSFKRYKELSIIGIGLGWVLFAVEANVSAHLKNFDVSDNISLKFSPTVIENGFSGRAAGVKITLNVR